VLHIPSQYNLQKIVRENDTIYYDTKKRELSFLILNTAPSLAKSMIKNLIDNFENHIDPNDPATNCLDVAIITDPKKRTQKTKDKLKTVAGRVLVK